MTTLPARSLFSTAATENDFVFRDEEVQFLVACNGRKLAHLLGSPILFLRSDAVQGAVPPEIRRGLIEVVHRLEHATKESLVPWRHQGDTVVGVVSSIRAAADRVPQTRVDVAVPDSLQLRTDHFIFLELLFVMLFRMAARASSNPEVRIRCKQSEQVVLIVDLPLGPGEHAFEEDTIDDIADHYCWNLSFTEGRGRRSYDVAIPVRYTQ